MKLAEISIKRSILAAMMIAALMVFGFFSFGRIGVELFPNVEFPVVTTTVIYPGADPATMELKVADKIEESLQGIGGVKRMTSRNLEGVSNVTLEFELEVDGNQALQDVRDKVAAIEQQLPDGIEPPIVQKFDIGASPVLTIALAGDMEIRALTKFAREQIKQRVQQDWLADCVFRFEQGDVLIDEVDIPGPLDLGDHDHVELVADMLDDLAEVVEYPRAVQRIDAHPHAGIGEIVVCQHFDEAGTRRLLGVDRNGVLEVAAHYIALAGSLGRLGADLFDVWRKEVDHALRSHGQFTQGLWGTNGERLVEMDW